MFQTPSSMLQTRLLHPIQPRFSFRRSFTVDLRPRPKTKYFVWMMLGFFTVRHLRT
jgi:hypothetical protein